MLFFVSITEKNIIQSQPTISIIYIEYNTLNKASLAGVFGGAVKDENNKHVKMIWFAF